MLAVGFRKAAWYALRGKWGTDALITLVFTVISGQPGLIICRYACRPIVSVITTFITGGAFLLGFNICFLAFARGENVVVSRMFDGFKQFKNAFLANVIIGVLVFLWALLFIIPGIIKGLSNSMTYFIMADDPQMDANEARKLSIKMMENHKWRLFCLLCSFIGWLLLCLLTLGILGLWIRPYMGTAQAEFYLFIKGKYYLKCSVQNSCQSAGRFERE